MNHRTVVYWTDSIPENGLALTSEPVKSQQWADDLLEKLQKLPGVTGGRTETLVPGVGWVVSEDAESVAYRAHTA